VAGVESVEAAVNCRSIIFPLTGKELLDLGSPFMSEDS
jgi:hypothetical protein